ALFPSSMTSTSRNSTRGSSPRSGCRGTTRHRAFRCNRAVLIDAMLGTTACGSRMPQPLTHTAPTPENQNELGPDLPNYYCKRHPAQGSSRPRHSMRGCAAAREADLQVQDEIGAKPSPPPTETRVSTGGA